MAASCSPSSDEGEIFESSNDKATTPPYHSHSADVDGRDRHSSSTLDGSTDVRPESSSRPRDSPSRSSSQHQASSSRATVRWHEPPLGSASKSRDRRRSPRGTKRHRDDDLYAPRDHDRGDRRTFQVRYEDRQRRKSSDRNNERERERNGRQGTPDRSRHNERSAGRFYKGRGRHEASRSRSPPRFRSDNRAAGSLFRVYDDEKRPEPASPSQPVGRNELSSTSELMVKSVRFAVGNDTNSSGVGDVQAEEADLESEPIDEAALIEQRRKRREAIKAKHRTQASPLIMQALNPLQPSMVSHSTIPETNGDSNATSAFTSTENSRQASPAILEISKDSDLANSPRTPQEDEGPSAADYDPVVDMQEDKLREAIHVHDADVPANAYDETIVARQNGSARQESRPTPANEKGDFDMFAEADEDIFAAEPLNSGPADASTAMPVSASRALDLSMLDDVDDPEGYYKIQLGELLESRYQVQTNLGRGMFSGVVRAQDQASNKQVAIKIIRNNETMRKAAAKEIFILEQLNAADPDDRKHVVRLERAFEHKGHLCMVFESLSINLREVLKKFGRDVGINLQAVRAYAQQMFLALSLFRRCNILHADLKPDNILVNSSRSSLKVCDLGSASEAGAETEITPYLVSRFYRAPEIILGMPLDFAIDTWSVGCTLFELYTGKILFTGRSNNQMLKGIMECRGKMPTRMLKKAELAGLHFEVDGSFRSVEREKATGRDVVRVLPLVKATRDLRQRVHAAGGTSSGANSKAGSPADAREVNLFVDFLDKCLALNPEKRITPVEALKHPFLQRRSG